ncbi:MAG: hypothetical protein RSB06_01385 [Clostridia bacterium]
MQNTFEHLLGLPTSAAVAILAAAGVTNVEVVPTAAPPRKYASADEERRSAAGEALGYASTRVVAVENDGQRLIVSRFLTGAPKQAQAPTPNV